MNRFKRSESKERLVRESDIAGAHAATVLVVNMASDEDSNEDFVTYGAPLEPLEEGTKNVCNEALICVNLQVFVT